MPPGGRAIVHPVRSPPRARETNDPGLDRAGGHVRHHAGFAVQAEVVLDPWASGDDSLLDPDTDAHHTRRTQPRSQEGSSGQPTRSRCHARQSWIRAKGWASSSS